MATELLVKWSFSSGRRMNLLSHLQLLITINHYSSLSIILKHWECHIITHFCWQLTTISRYNLTISHYKTITSFEKTTISNYKSSFKPPIATTNHYKTIINHY